MSGFNLTVLGSDEKIATKLLTVVYDCLFYNSTVEKHDEYIIASLTAILGEFY